MPAFILSEKMFRCYKRILAWTILTPASRLLFSFSDRILLKLHISFSLVSKVTLRSTLCSKRLERHWGQVCHSTQGLWKCFEKCNMNTVTEYLHHKLTFADKAPVIHIKGEPPLLQRCHLWFELIADVLWDGKIREKGNKIMAGFLTAHSFSHWLKQTSDPFVLTETQNIRGLEAHYS